MNVVITGSSKGIGFALAEEFTKQADNVILSSRKLESIEKVTEQLKKKYPKAEIYGTVCDVSKTEDIKKLLEFAKENLGIIDIWINNAGTTADRYDNLVNFSDNELKKIVDTNLLGTLYGCKEALKVMKNQGRGQIFNISGMGAKGMLSPNLAAYGATKCAVYQLTKTLARENKKTGIGIHVLLPGMTLTDLFLNNTSPEAARIFNIIGDTPENVANFLVKRIKKIKGTGKAISYLSTIKASWRFLTARSRKNKFFDADGNLIS